jgi:hypothetical protein
MTWALCLNCGEVKFGAICPCPKCGVASTGDMNLDIAFSDHNIHKESLHQLGSVIAAIHQVSTDDELSGWAFIYYISTQHPTILGVNLAPELRQKCEQLLSRAQLPAVELNPSARGTANSQERKTKAWWQFWKTDTTDQEDE